MTLQRLDQWDVLGGQEVRKGRSPRVPASPWTTLMTQNFDSLALANPVTQAVANAALGQPGGSGTYPDFAIIANGGGKAWRWHSPAGTFDSASGTNGLAGFYSKPFTDWIAVHGIILKAAIEYDATFPDDMDWSLGGKLPGLGGTATTANPPTGGAGPTADGWSCRSMWRGPASGTYFGRRALSPNEWVGYRYYINQPYAGENIWSSRSFIAGQTHKIRQEYGMNSIVNGVAQADGVHKMYFDGTLVNDTENLIWRTNAALGINRNLWHFFRGGNDDTWDGDVDNDVIFDNLKIEVGTP